jgi:hypothetical protein
MAAFGGHLSAGSPGEMFREKFAGMDIQRNIRLFLPLMVNVECWCRMNFS